MKNHYLKIIIFVLLSSLVSGCGASSTSTTPNNSSVVQQKANRAGNTAVRRVDQHTDLKINNAIDRLFRKL